MSIQQGLAIVNQLNQLGNEAILKNLQIEAAVINMYAKCSHFDEAINKFNGIDIDKESIELQATEHDILCLYASIIDCHAKLGDIENVLRLFEELQSYEHVKVSNTIYCIVLNACSHSGSVDEAMNIFEQIRGLRHTSDTVEMHPNIINAVIDCLSRSGNANNLDRAENVYLDFCHKNERIYHQFKLQMLLSLLSACRINNDGNRAQRIYAFVQSIAQNHQIDEEWHESARLLLAGVEKTF